jgi:hypothetical protein
MSYLYKTCDIDLTWNFPCSYFCIYVLFEHSLGLCCRCSEQHRIHLGCGLLGYKTI